MCQSPYKQRQYCLYNLPIYHCHCFSANSLPSCEAWQFVQVIELQVGGEEWFFEHLYHFVSPHPQLWFPLISSFSLTYYFLTVSLIWFYSFYQQMPISLSDGLSLSPIPTPALLLPPTLSFALCVRVCRWLLLAGSVTRGNWGRVHFNRTNGNKLIHFRCCLRDDVWAAGKKM